MRSDGFMIPRYEIEVTAVACGSGIGRGPAGTIGSGATVTHYITLHSPSFCWPILLLVMRSR